MSVIYSINGKFFTDFGIYVSESKGLVDALKRRRPKAYTWAEYHGISVDLSRPKFEAREITLNCFIIGENWDVLLNNFNAFRDEFANPDTQRLLIEPFGFKALPYQVYLSDEIDLQKKFAQGKMAATFSLKLIEPNPIKKVLYFEGGQFSLSYNSTTETEIFYSDLTKDIVPGNASLNGKTLPAGYIIIAGNMEDVTGFTSNATVVWDVRSIGIIAPPPPPPADTQVPSAPTGLSVTNVGVNTLALNWNAATDNVGVSGYNVYVNGEYRTFVQGTSVNLTGLFANTQYSFYVQAKDAAGNTSAASATITGKTAAAPDTTSPSVVTNLAAGTTTETTIPISWTAATDNVGVTGYEVWVDGSLYQTVTNTSTTIFDRAAGTSYTIDVYAKDAAGNKSAKARVTATTKAAVSAIVQTGLALHYNSNSYTSGSTITDIAGGDDNGTIYGGVTKDVSGLSFNGSTGYIQSARPLNLGSNEFTIELWFNSKSSEQQAILESRSTGWSTGDWVVFFVNNKVSMSVMDIGDPIIECNTLSVNTNYHLAITRIGSEISIYINGNFVRSFYSSTSIGSGNLPITIGRDNVAGGRFFFNGNIPIIRVYNGKGLTSVEISQNFNAEKSQFNL